jgi:diaminohydroxyphosphoribosylaminopyrimidine deaminase/5-amino-6-(5-phosphoribosylamino)uracil reductase
VLSTGEAGPVIIVTSAVGAARAGARRALEDRGAVVEVVRDGTLRTGLERLGARQIGSLLLEGGAVLQGAAWTEAVVDLVRLYVTPHVIGPGGVRLFDGRGMSTGELFDRRVEPLGPDTLIEGYVHRSH